MDSSKLKQYAAVAGLFAVAGFLFYYSTWTEEERMILSDATLQGKITYKGKPVPHALVIVSNENSSASGAADADGNYFVQHVPVGSVQIGVNTEAGRGMMMSAVMAASQGGGASSKPTFVDLPQKYFNPTTSGLTATVENKKGENTFDIEVK